MKILLVEDDPTTAQIMRDTMKVWKQEVYLASSGKEAVRAAESRQFDLVLLDIMLPDGYGYDFIPKIRMVQPDLMIITMTGNNTPEMEKRVRQHSITYYMAKPVNFDELKDILNHISKRTAA